MAHVFLGRKRRARYARRRAKAGRATENRKGNPEEGLQVASSCKMASGNVFFFVGLMDKANRTRRQKKAADRPNISKTMIAIDRPIAIDISRRNGEK